MNKQGTIVNGRVIGGIEWTKTILPNGLEEQGYTWNVIGGCKHACRWDMPDGDTAICYAEEVAIRMRSDKFYPNGFDHHYWHPDRLNEPDKIKKPAKIFLDSMSDLMGHWVPDEQIQMVLDTCARNPHHIFQLLTKNAPRLLKFNFPNNVWVGVSSPPTQFMGKNLTLEQQSKYIYRALNVLRDVNAKVRWMSIEPLSFDISAIFKDWCNDTLLPLPLEWVVIGAATNGKTVYQPDPQWIFNLVGDLHREGVLNLIPVFYKGNLRGNRATSNPFEWREEFPILDKNSSDNHVE